MTIGELADECEEFKRSASREADRLAYRLTREKPPAGASWRGLRDRFNHQWIIGRIGHRAPAQYRRILLGEPA